MQFDGLVAFYHTKDLDETHRFYHEILGLPLYKDQGACRIYTVQPDALIGFCNHFPEAAPEGIIITLLTDAVDDMYARVRDQEGIEIIEPPARNDRFNIYHFFLRDPNGYKVEIQTFLD